MRKHDTFIGTEGGPAGSPRFFLLDAFFLAVAFGHLAVDLLNGSQTVLLTYLSVPLALSNTALAAIGTTYTILGSISQPLFGFIADRIGGRWVVALGVIWMGAFFSLAVISPGTSALVFLVLASLGSGAFHPAGAMLSTDLGRNRFNRETTTTAYFFLSGQAGLSLGPLIGGFLLAGLGTPGILVLTALVVPVGINAVHRLRAAGGPRMPSAASGDAVHRSWNVRVIVALAIIAGFRIWAQQNMALFLPKHLSDLGFDPRFYGSVAALFMGGTAIGGVLGGSLADRYGNRRVAMISQLIAFFPLATVPFIEWIPWFFIIVPVAGLFSGMAHSIVVVLAQRIIPGGMGLASGLILGFMFSSGALGVLLSGYIADFWSIPVVFGLSSLLLLAAAGLSTFMQDPAAPRS